MSKRKTPDDFVKEIVEYIKALPHDEAMEFACESIFQSVLWAGENHIELLGILDCVRTDVVKFVIFPDDEDDDGDDWKKLINRN